MDTKIRPDLISADVHTAVLWVLVLVLAAAWAGAHWLKSRLNSRFLQVAGFGGRVLLGSITIWVIWQAVSRTLLLTTDWKLWTHAVIGALAVEVVMFLYQLERRIVSPRLGKLLTALRLAAVGAVLLMLVQPVFSWQATEQIERKVVVLVDDSASMQIADPQMSVEERVDLAQFYGIDALKDRPNVGKNFEALREASKRFEKMIAALDVPEGFGADAEKAVVEKQKQPLEELLKQTAAAAEELRKSLREMRDLSDDSRRVIAEIERSLNNPFQERSRDAAKRMNDGRVREARNQVQQANTVLTKVLERSSYLSEIADEKYYQTVPAEARKKIDDVAARTRAELARETMLRPRTEGKNLIDALKEKYGVQLTRFGRKAVDVTGWEFPPAKEDEEFRLRTDLTGALSKIVDSVNPDNLAGVLLLSDARHNTDEPVDDVVGKLGRQGAPICPVLIGSQKGSKDAAIVTVSAPQAIYQGDRVRTRVELKADGMRGQTVKLRLFQDGSQVAEESVTVPEDTYRATVRLSYLPKAAGIFRHDVKVDPIDGELFKNNNEWGFQTAVSDDRTTVLLIDDRPRWEFRYLRNLFDSRDKSVHLQYVLLHPDELQGEGRPSPVAASASRKFGDSEAGKLPEKAEEWKKFDAIILGDLPPAALGEETWKTIRQCVEDRGALLVMISGPNAMPHAFANETFEELCPVLYEHSNRAFHRPPEEAYRIERTAEGINHLIMAQGPSLEQSRAVWSGMPTLRWRHAIKGVKESAEVLAYARPVQLDAAGGEIRDAAAITSFDPAALQKQKELERQNALVVVSQFGSGKVAMLNFDHTWRFRYGIGDTYHHRFWGQMLRWGTGENLRAGNELVRLGTDKLTYEAGEKISIMAKLQEQDYRPVADAEVYATLFRGPEKVGRRKLEFRKDSHGMYDALIDPPAEAGDYRVELSGSEVERLFKSTGASVLETKLTIAAAGNPIEFGDLSVDREMAAKLASKSGGIVVTPGTAASVLDYFGPPSREKQERKEITLWDNWILLAAAVGLLTAEWIFRRRGGLI